MQTGPSKEELKNYWDNSRQYFEELARHYRETDPEYYNEYIAPFYSNPFYAMSSGRRKGRLGAVMATALLILGIGAGAVFFILQNRGNEDRDSETERKTEKVIPIIPPKVESPTSKGRTEPAAVDSSYVKGLKYFNDEDYDNAERYFRKVKSSDPNYAESRKKLNRIMVLKRRKMEEELKRRDGK